MGDTGVGKSVVMQKYLDDAAKTEKFVAYTMKYSAQTKPVNLKVRTQETARGMLSIAHQACTKRMQDLSLTD